MRAKLEAEFAVTAVKLTDQLPIVNPDAVIIAIDLRRADYIALLRRGMTNLQSDIGIFVLDPKAHFQVIQTHALGATEVVARRGVQRVIRAKFFQERHTQNLYAKGVAEAGAAAFADMFQTVREGGVMNLASAQVAGQDIADAVASEGLTTWLDTVRRHHEGISALPFGNGYISGFWLEPWSEQNRHCTFACGRHVPRRRQSSDTNCNSRQGRKARCPRAASDRTTPIVGL